MVAGDDGSPEAYESRLAIGRFPATPRSSGLVAATYGQYRWWLLDGDREPAAASRDGAKADRGRYHPFVDPYMTKTAELLREGKGRLDRLSTVLRASTPEFSVLQRRRRLKRAEARYAVVSRHFEQLRAAGTEGIADLKVALEKAWAAFTAEIDWKA
jgi:hypothetical protein